MKALLGGKGANLAEMTNLGLPVPPGFTITTEVCSCFYDHGAQLSRRARRRRSTTALADVETSCGSRFGDPGEPAAGLGALGRAASRCRA